ncbi:phage tail tip fiber protein [Cronobacter sakazakii]|uniref:phage tail tip fiber protein n=1 Tax=Cronobacter sakazakii TaxID=28141 RepID=UPI000A0FA2EE|nr:phage tail protein [Cronobacter sakazakii]
MDQFKKKKLPLLIAGAGGKKKGGGSSRTPVEANDTVNSRAMASILDLLGEGVIGGLVDGAKSIFIDNLPIINEDGSSNFSGITWEFRDGSQDQSPMAGFDFVETPKSVNIQLKRTHPVTVAIDNDDADRVRVIMKFPSLRSISKKSGDTNGTTVQYRFQIANGDDTFRDAIPEGEKSAEITLTAKKSGVYYRSYELKLPKPGRSYKIRVTRLTDDSTSSYLFNDTWVDSIGEIVDTPMNYPNSVLCGLKVNSEQFGGTMPARSYLVRGLKIRVPANYNETSNIYVGVWDGTFKLLSSSNPAWILFDLLTNTRYGLGQFVSESMIDLGQLYQIGRYCDEEVNDGFGGKEKRFAINTQITSRQDAYRLIQDIAGAFRGMVFWAGGMVNIMQDSPSDPVMMFTNANVKDGMFTYKGSARKDRPSVALITYNNKEDGYKQNVEYVEDQEAMARYGERKTESVAFGCTSRGQAHRVGLWLLYTARMESDMITFTAGLDASFLMPGETVLIQNKYRAGKRNSGRIMAFDRNSITLDAPVTLMKNGSFIRILNQDAEIVERDILETGENITKVTFKKALAPNEMPVLNGVWTITEPDLEPMRVRIISIAQGDTAGSFDITAVENNPTKYEAIDNGATLIAQNTTVLDPTYSKPSNLQISEGTYISSPGNLSVKLIATWEGKSPEYWISWRRSDENHVSNWQSARVTEEQYEIANVAENGQYDFQLYAVSFSGKKTEVISTVYKVLGTMTPPSAPSGLTAVGDYRNVILNWVNPDSVDLDHINVYASRINDLSTAKLVAEAASTTFTHAGLGDSETWFYWVRAVNKRGMLSPPNSNFGTEAMTRDVLSFLTGKITSSELGQELLEEIDTKVSQEAVDAIYQQMEDSLNSLGEKLTAADQRLEEAQSSLKTEVAGTLDKVGQALQQVEGSNAALVELQNTVSEQGKSVAGVVEAANAALDKASALIAEEREARVEADLANAKQIDAMKSSVDDSVAAVEEMKRTVAGVEQASTEVTTSLEALARANIDLALRQDEDQYKQSVTNAKISTTQKTFADDISAMASKVEEIRAEIGDNIRASITEETTSRVEADKAIASQITRLEARLNDDIAAALTEEQEARATADETLSRQITALKAQTDENVKAAISVETKARTDADSALATQISTLKSQTAQDIQAAVAAETKARTDADSALSGQITSLQAQTKDISAAVTSESSARANADGALGSRIDTLKASVDGHTATIQQQAQAIADTNKKVSTAWTLKMETAASGGQRYVAGIALGIDTTGLSQFLVQADRFGLVNSVNGRITTPFVVENGVAYMNGAYIKDGTITHAKVGDLQSTNFVSGRSGWRLGKNGVLEINGSSGGHGRLVITGQRIDVYDDNNVLRVRLGQL